MIAFVIRRLLQSILVMLAVALIAFGLFRYVGDPTRWGGGIRSCYIAPVASARPLHRAVHVVLPFPDGGALLQCVT